MAMVEQLLHILEELNEEEFKKFMFCLSRVDTDPHIPSGKLDGASRIRVAELLEKRYPKEALDLTNQVLHKIPRRDLIQGSWLQAGEAGNSSDDASCSEAVNSGAGAREPRAQEKQRLVSEQQLMTLARKMGKTWQQIGIELLGLKKHSLEQIEENNPGNATMRAFEMLLEWRKQARQGNNLREGSDLRAMEREEEGAGYRTQGSFYHQAMLPPAVSCVTDCLEQWARLQAFWSMSFQAHHQNKSLLNTSLQTFTHSE